MIAKSERQYMINNNDKTTNKIMKLRAEEWGVRINNTLEIDEL